MRTLNPIRQILLTIVVLALIQPVPVAGQQPADQIAPRQAGPDERFKVDILLVVAHPDDESGVTSYLARAMFDQGKRVAVVYTTEGDAGRNRKGTEQGLALGAIRQMETRAALEALGIEHAWFAGGKDTASQNALLSLANWTHGEVLERVVSIVRLTRPEVIISWMPRNVAGENHGDHQASGIIATEAFDMAGDPTAFPGQLAFARLRQPTENLRTWQPKKLYFYTDAADSSFTRGKGPAYSVMDVSPSRKAPYRFFALKSALAHESQFGPRFPQALREALEKNDVEAAMRIASERNPNARDETRLIFGKSRVGGTPVGDVFEGITPGAIPFTPPRPSSPRPETPPGVQLTLGDSWSYYPEFWRAHELDHLSGLTPPEIAVKPASDLPLPLVLSNDTDQPLEFTIALADKLPDGWAERPMPSVYKLGPRESYSFTATLVSPAAESRAPDIITWVVKSGGREVASRSMRVFVLQGAMAHAAP